MCPYPLLATIEGWSVEICHPPIRRSPLPSRGLSCRIIAWSGDGRQGAPNMKIERSFEIEKETKNTLRYAEVAEGQPPVIGTLYVQKRALKGVPKRIQVTIDVVEEEKK
jgi:hypothetical protein